MTQQSPPPSTQSKLSKALCHRLSIALLLTAGVSIAIGVMEWLFFYTKPSFMAFYGLVELVTLAILPALWLFVCSSVLVAVLYLLPLPTALRGRAALLVPAALLSSLVVILLDNFVYTIFGWGIVSSAGVSQYALMGLYFVLYISSFRYLSNISAAYQKTPPLLLFIVLAGVMGSAGVTMVVMVAMGWPADPSVMTDSADEPTRRPNIIFFAADGVEARLTSAYGYQLDTTPALKQIASNSLVFANAFTTSGKSTGAITSMLTGIQPFRSKVGYPPQALSGQHAFQHLPAILRSVGYRGFQAGVQYFIDGREQNMQQSFDVSNGQALWNPYPDSMVGKLAFIFSDEVYFSRLIIEWFSSRLEHVLGIQRMVNHFELVSQDPGLNWDQDRKAVNDLVEFVRHTDQPYFAHIHLMGTHCCEHGGAKAQLMAEISGPNTPEIDAENAQRRYINTIRDADDQMAFLLQELSALGALDNTILIISSDHSRNWSSLQRVPLVISFPDEKHTGVVHNNVQLVDIAPTLLDYMGIKKPDWMGGRSLTSIGEQTDKPLMTMESFHYAEHSLKPSFSPPINNPGPPRYGTAEVGVIICNIGKRVSLDSGAIVSHEIDGHTRPCPAGEIPDDPWVRRYVKERLQEHGFEALY